MSMTAPCLCCQLSGPAAGNPTPRTVNHLNDGTGSYSNAGHSTGVTGVDPKLNPRSPPSCVGSYSGDIAIGVQMMLCGCSFERML